MELIRLSRLIERRSKYLNFVREPKAHKSSVLSRNSPGERAMEAFTCTHPLAS